MGGSARSENGDRHLPRAVRTGDVQGSSASSSLPRPPVSWRLQTSLKRSGTSSRRSPKPTGRVSRLFSTLLDREESPLIEPWSDPPQLPRRGGRNRSAASEGRRSSARFGPTPPLGAKVLPACEGRPRRPGRSWGTLTLRHTLSGGVNVARTDVGRRRVLAGLVAAPMLAAAAGAVTRLGAHAATLRPSGRGTSAQRCGSCGSWDHGMLASDCPARPKVEWS